MCNEQVQAEIDLIYQAEARRIFASLVGLLGDFDLAEDALHDAFRAAIEQWPETGVPTNPRAWLVSTGRFKAIDMLRRRKRFDAKLQELAYSLAQAEPEVMADHQIPDDRLRLIFTCCHPLLSPDARVALTLREVCGLTTEAIAHAFLTNPTTLAQRIVRAKAKIRDLNIPYQVPEQAELPERLHTVLQVMYLVFNEGYSASSGASLTQPRLSNEAIRLGRLLVRLLPSSETLGLLALMLLHESRREARTSVEGELIVLEEQDRSLWNKDLILEGVGLIRTVFRTPPLGPYALQAAIAAVHATAPTLEATNWQQIIDLYDLLLNLQPSPLIELNRAVAVAMHAGPAAGLGLMHEIMERGELQEYHLAHAAQADLLRRLGDVGAARKAYERALALVQQEPQRRFLERQLARLES